MQEVGNTQILGFWPSYAFGKAPMERILKRNQTDQTSLATAILENSKTASSTLWLLLRLHLSIYMENIFQVWPNRAWSPFFSMERSRPGLLWAVWASCFAPPMCQGMNSEPSGCHGGLQKRKSMEELGYHKATLSSILAVVICGTGSAQTPLFHTSLHLSATAQSTCWHVLICGHDMTKKINLCSCLLQTNVWQRRALKVSAASPRCNMCWKHITSSCKVHTWWPMKCICQVNPSYALELCA